MVHKYDHEFPDRYFKDFLEYMDISEEAFYETLDKFRPDHLWEKKSNKWVLKKSL